MSEIFTMCQETLQYLKPLLSRVRWDLILKTSQSRNCQGFMGVKKADTFKSWQRGIIRMTDTLWLRCGQIPAADLIG